MSGATCAAALRAHWAQTQLICGSAVRSVCVVKMSAGGNLRITAWRGVMASKGLSVPEWWRCNSGSIPHFSSVLRALLTNAPNSCPPERLFSMFNATFGEDQRSAFGDYLELAMQSQYNKRNL